MEFIKTFKIGDYTYNIKERNSYSFTLFCNKEEPINNHDEWELSYNGNERKMELIRNGRKVKANENNLDEFLPKTANTYTSYGRHGQASMNSYKSIEKVLKELLFADIDSGEYRVILNSMDRETDERVIKLSRILLRLTNKHQRMEVLVKDSSLKMEALPWVGYYVKNQKYDESPTKPHQVLKVEPHAYRFIKKLSQEALKDGKTILNEYSLQDIQQLSKEQIDIYSSYIKHFLELKEKYNNDDHRSLEDFVEFHPTSLSNYKAMIVSNEEFQPGFRRAGNGRRYRRYANSNRNLYSFAKAYNYDVKRLIEYILFEVYIEQGITSGGTAFELLRDYVVMSSEINGHNQYEKYPKSLKLVHDTTSLNYDIILNEKDEIRFKEVVTNDDYENLTYTSKEFSIISPKEAKDLSKEGSNLNHCLASYTNRLIDGNLKIYFMRKTDDIDKSLITIQVNETGLNDGQFKYEIVQARGQSNRNLDPAEKQWLNEYAENKKIRMSNRINY